MDDVKNYDVPYGCMGYIDGSYMLFASDSDYIEQLEAQEEE